MNLIKCFQTHSTWYKKAERGSKPVGILWHDTAGGNPTLKRYVQPYEGDADYDNLINLLGKNKYNNDWNHIYHEAGLNAWIGQLADGSVATIQAGEWDIHPWGNGGDRTFYCESKTSAKIDSTISIAGELYNKSGKAYFKLGASINTSPKNVNAKQEFDTICKVLNLGSGKSLAGSSTLTGKVTACTAQTDGTYLITLSGASIGCCNGYIRNSNGIKTWINEHWIQFEICDDGYKDEAYFKKVYKEACEFTAYICKLYNIDPKGTYKFNGADIPTILCHADSYQLGVGGNHGDVYSWFNKFGYTMEDVRNDVAALLDQKEEVIPDPTPTHEFIKGDLVKITGDTYYGGEKAIPTWVKNLKWYVLEAVKDRIVLGQDENKKYNITSAVNSKDLELVKAYEEPKKKEVYSGIPSTGDVECRKRIWDFFLSDFKNEYAVAGLMGNLYAESGFISDNLQNTFNASLNMSDKIYTAQVDSGEYTNFKGDSAGYGLAQWTYPTRKERLYNYCQSCKKSIGDFETQLAFILKELKENYKSFYETLVASTSVREASNLVLIKYEAPASKDTQETQDLRYSYSQKFFDEFGTKIEPQPEPDPEIDNNKDNQDEEIKPIPEPEENDKNKDDELQDEEVLSWVIKLFRLIFSFFKELFDKKKEKDISETPASISDDKNNISDYVIEDDFCEYSDTK